MNRHHLKKSKQPNSLSMGKNEKNKTAHNKESSLKVKPSFNPSHTLSLTVIFSSDHNSQVKDLVFITTLICLLNHFHLLFL